MTPHSVMDSQWWLHTKYSRRGNGKVFYTRLQYPYCGLYNHLIDKDMASCFSLSCGDGDKETHLFSWMYVHWNLPCNQQEPRMPIHYLDWKHTYQVLFKQTHLDYKERGMLFTYLWGNGMPAERAAECVLRAGTYDFSAKRHVWSLVLETKRKDPILLRYNVFVHGDPANENDTSFHGPSRCRMPEAREAPESCDCGYEHCPNFVYSGAD